MLVALSLEKIDSISEKSSPEEMAPLIKRCKARSPESGEGGGPTGAGKLHPRYTSEWSWGFDNRKY